MNHRCAFLSVLFANTFLSLVAQPGTRISLKCSSSTMTIFIPKTMLSAFSQDDLHLQNASCGATESVTHFILETKLTDCGTVHKQTGNIIRYSNVVLDRVFQSTLIARPHQLRIPFRCGYFRKKNVTLNPKPKRKKKIIPRIMGEGHLQLAFKLFPNKTYQTSYKSKDFPVSVPTNKELFFELKLDVVDRQLSINVKHCYATPTLPENSGILKHDIIRNGCATDDTVTIYKTQSSRQQRFSLQAFKFNGLHQSVFFYCRVVICNTSDSTIDCSRQCGGPIQHDRSRRSPGGPLFQLVEGPVIFTSVKGLTFKPSVPTERHSNSGSSNEHILPIMFVTMAILLLMYLLYSVRRTKEKALHTKTVDQVQTVPPPT